MTTWEIILGCGAVAVLLLLLLLKLGGRGRRDLLGPPKAKPRKLSTEELDRLTELVGRGEEAEALRRLKEAGFDEAASRRLLWWMAKVAAADAEG